jgi:uncharacterized membrane protein
MFPPSPLIFGAVLVARYVWLGKTASSSSPSAAELSPQQIATQRFDRGEINEQEHRHLLQVLSGGSAEIPK